MDYFDLGQFSCPITTHSSEAQDWFNRGLVWVYGYHHEEAIECFHRALKADANCAMAHWGVAYAIGPNYNKAWDAFEDDEKPVALEMALAACAKAISLAEEVSNWEKALIQAIAVRYPDSPEIEDFSPWNDAYADAMRGVHQQHANNPDVCALLAEAMMNRTPWQLWELATGEPAEGADTLEAVEVLESAFQSIPNAWSHPGLLHMYIHLMEMSPFPERALPHGDCLSSLVPDAGHLLHMPTHIDVLCGEYMNVVARNGAAIVADKRYLKRAGAENFYSIYRCHNYHFKIYGAMFLGQFGPAMEAAEELTTTVPDAVLRPLADWFEAFVPMKQHVLIRFGKWQDILDQPLPEDEDLYTVTRTMMRYARAVALANLKELTKAGEEAALFYSARDRVQESRMLFNNTCLDILAIAEQMMLGEIAYHRGDYDEAFDHLRHSVSLDDSLPYDEPWGWMQPTRHALGALLLEQDRLAEAESVYRADLGLDNTLSRACQHPGNVWALFGLHECLRRRGETVELAHVRAQLTKAQARADVPIKASCYCAATA